MKMTNRIGISLQKHERWMARIALSLIYTGGFYVVSVGVGLTELMEGMSLLEACLLEAVILGILSATTRFAPRGRDRLAMDQVLIIAAASLFMIN